MALASRTLLRQRPLAEDTGFRSEDSAESEPSDSTDSEAALEEFQEKTGFLRRVAEKQDRVRTTFRAQCGLAASVAAWVVIFGLPMNNVHVYRSIFGYRGSLLEAAQEDLYNRRFEIGADDYRFNKTINKLRISCQGADTGKMRNVAGPFQQAKLVRWTNDMHPWNVTENVDDIWCGYLNENYLTYWPNVGQLIIFSVFKSTGTTIKLAWQGIIGTFFAALNLGLMQQVFPVGAKGHQCGSSVGYTTIFHQNGMFYWMESTTFEKARLDYINPRFQAGLDARGIFENNGTVLPYYSWSLNWELWNKMVAKVKEINNENCIPGETVHDGNYNKWICLIDVIVVLFLFLVSRSATNTIMFGMSWHVCFMMDFMNPSVGAQECHGWECVDDGSVRGAVFKTTLIGATVSVLATLTVSVALPICNLRNLEEDSLAVTQSVTQIWEDSLSYMSGRHRSAKRFHIVRQIAEADSIMSGAQEDANGAWWETLDQGTCGSKRLLLMEYDLCTADIRGMLNVLANCVVSEDFQGQHTYFFCERMLKPMKALEREVYQLMYMIVQACIDGVISDAEAKVIRKVVLEVKLLQEELVSTFRKALPDISSDLAEEIIFAFALSFWARKLSDFGEQVAALSSKHAHKRNLFVDLTVGFFKTVWTAFRDTWSPRRLFCDREHLKFAVRNLLSIGLVYAFAYFVPTGSVFEQYSSTMPATLSLLVVADGTHQIGSMIYKNVHRLLAVVLGKVLPVMITSAFTYWGCLTTTRFVVQFSTTWFYLFVFTYIYYASPMWGYVGCLIAGLGCYQLLCPCTQEDDKAFLQHYKEIGAVTFAIFVQAVVHSLLSYHTPVQLEVRAVRSLSDAFTDGFKAFFQNDLQAMQAAAKDAATHLATAKGLLRECDPKLKVMRCGEKDFKLDLCTRLLRLCEHLLGDLNLLIIASKDWVPNESVQEASAQKDVGNDVDPVEILTSLPAAEDVQSELMASLEATLELFLAVLGAEEVENNKDLEDLRVSLEAAPQLYTEVKARLDELRRGGLQEGHSELTSDLAVRLNVLVRALENAEQHLAMIAEKCLAEFGV